MMKDEIMYTPEDLRLSAWDGQLGGVGVKRYSYNGNFDGDYASTTEAGAEELRSFYNTYPFLQDSVPADLPKREQMLTVSDLEEKSPGQLAVEELLRDYSFLKVENER